MNLEESNSFDCFLEQIRILNSVEVSSEKIERYRCRLEENLLSSEKEVSRCKDPEIEDPNKFGK